MRDEARLTVLHGMTLLLLVLVTITIVQGRWFLLVLALAALLTSSFYAHRYVDERLDGGGYPRHGDRMD